MSRDQIKYPEIDVTLVGVEQMPPVTVMATVGHALRKARVSAEEISRYYEETLNGTLSDLVPIAKRWVRVLCL